MMTETTDHSPGWSDPRLAALEQADLPSFIIGWPTPGSGNATVLEATEACARQGLPAGIRAPEQASEIARGLISNPHRPFALARLRLPAASSPYLFYCSLLDLETGPAVLFADPAASIQSQQGSPGTTDMDAPIPTASSPAKMEPEIEPATESAPLRFTFETDDTNRLRAVSPTLLRALGQDAPHWLGATFQELEDGGWIISGEDVIRALNSAASFAGVRVTTPGPIVLDLEVGGLPLFDASRRRVATRGFGILRTWPNTRTSNWIKSFEPETGRTPGPPLVPSSARAASGEVPFNSALSPRDSETFRDIGRTLHAVMAQGEDVTPATQPPLPELAVWNEDGDSTLAEPPVTNLLPGPRTRALLDALPFATLLEREGTVMHLNRTFLEWSGFTDIEAFLDAGPLTYLVQEDDEGHASIITAQGESLLLDARTVTTGFLAPEARLLLLNHPSAPDLTPEVLATTREEALDKVPWPVLLLDENCGIHFANAATVHLLGYSAAELLSQPFTIAVPPDARSETISWIDDIARRDDKNSTQSRRLCLRDHAGESLSVLAGLARMDTDDSLLCLVLGPVQSETDSQTRPAPDLPLEIARNPAQEAEAQASSPVALHLAARRLAQSLGPAFETLLDAPDHPEDSSAPLSHSVADALRAVRQCLHDLAALAEPAPSSVSEIFDPTPVVEEALAYVQPSARRRRIVLRVDLAPVPTVQSQPAHLARLVRVMLEEALEATPAHGAVLVSLGCDEDMPGSPVRLEIADAGTALDEVDLASARAPLSPAPGTDRFTLAGRPMRHARLVSEAEAIGGHFTVRRGQTRGMHAILELPRGDDSKPAA